MVRLFWVIGIIRAFEGVEVIKPFVIQNGQSGQKLVLQMMWFIRVK